MSCALLIGYELLDTAFFIQHKCCLSNWFQKVLQVAGSHRILHLHHRFGLDLANSLASNLEDSANLFERVRVSVGQTITQANDLALAECQ